MRMDISCADGYLVMKQLVQMLLTPARARILLGLDLIAVSALAFMPGPEVPMTTHWDKGDHTLAFFSLSLLARLAWPRQPFWRIALALVGYGVFIEIVQAFLPTRDAEALDVLADSTGIALFVFCAWLYRKFNAAYLLKRSPT